MNVRRDAESRPRTRAGRSVPYSYGENDDRGRGSIDGSAGSGHWEGKTLTRSPLPRSGDGRSERCPMRMVESVRAMK
jgi:hypothetical protein